MTTESKVTIPVTFTLEMTERDSQILKMYIGNLNGLYPCDVEKYSRPLSETIADWFLSLFEVEIDEVFDWYQTTEGLPDIPYT